MERESVLTPLTVPGEAHSAPVKYLLPPLETVKQLLPPLEIVKQLLPPLEILIAGAQGRC